ncbi:phage protein Gp27 family protein [Aurantimonas sp. 22II-16-19i]|uniref:DUF3486 family protein n=1 Tax=Aurantimonas sp. 22II-16-19i TaxID=1317114 RepID=UPI0009F7D412|nr:phage protein Gp27 family protein [Aurantimonas sp. 22II-16-19i]ORE93215.1 Mu-like phage gp27 [Aurantimonas sp. 22II-16-19i]
MATGRGRLSSIDLLPDDADPDIDWAMEQLRDRSMTQAAILKEFNSRLADRGIAPISSGAFSRHTVRLAKLTRDLERTRAIASTLVDHLRPEDDDKMVRAIAQVIKNLVLKLLEKGENLVPKDFMEIARAMKDLAAAQGLSTQGRRGFEKEFTEKANAAIDAVSTERGFSKETVADIKSKILGIQT